MDNHLTSLTFIALFFYTREAAALGLFGWANGKFRQNVLLNGKYCHSFKVDAKLNRKNIGIDAILRT